MSRFLNIMSQALQAVKAFKLRTSFCLVSVALGIASITIIVAATEGAYQKAFDIVALFGPDSLLVLSGSDEARAIGQREKTLTLEDVKAVEESFPQAYMVMPMLASPGTNIAYRQNKHQTLVVGSTADYSRGWTWPVVQGSDLTDEDVRGGRNVALLGAQVVRNLFGQEDPIGKYIVVKGIPVQVVGVLSERGMTPTGANMDDRIVMPITTVMRKLVNERRYVSVFRVRFTDQSRLSEHQEELRLFLRQRHNLADGTPDDFRIISPREVILFLVALTGSLVLFLGLVGGISLVVAGFVLANLFLLSVRERTREIGIRRAVGATRGDIRFQFLGEAVIITTLGGLAGFALGVVGSRVLTLVAEFPIHFSWKAFAAGVLLSWLVGVGFGLKPAATASNLEPIEAMRG
ncbi:MAG: ABC transporter permease [Syntrophobacteraceae bacterium]|jgi:putative ABC transport system permease protein|nr:ABC transporter permease [Syntrophobacteraceae bacterium]